MIFYKIMIQTEINIGKYFNELFQTRFIDSVNLKLKQLDQNLKLW